MISMFRDKHVEGQPFSMTRTLAAIFAVAYVIHWTLPLGWPDAFVAFVILFSIGISKAIQGASPQAVLNMISKMFGEGTPAQIIGGVPFMPQQWAHGDPDEGVL